MRSLLSAFLLAAATLGIAACADQPPGAPAPAATVQAPAAEAPASRPVGNTFTGAIAEAMNTSGYTYARLQGASGDVWIAATEFDAKVGEQVTVSLDLPMEDFDSKTLNRHFKLLYFVTEVARDGQSLRNPSPAAGPSLMTSHGGDAPAAAGAPTVVKLDPPAGGVSIADAFAKRAELAGKAVTVRGTVVKFNVGILDRNWVHLQDGSGSPDAHDNDLMVTTDATVQVGDVVTATGVLRIDQDFGAGYAYDVMIEKATFGK